MTISSEVVRIIRTFWYTSVKRRTLIDIEHVELDSCNGVLFQTPYKQTCKVDMLIVMTGKYQR